RRDASPRRRGFVVAIGLLNLSNLAIFVLPCLDLVQQALGTTMPVPIDPSLAPVSPTLPPGSPVESGNPEDAVVFAVIFSILLLSNLAVGIYSLTVGLRVPEEAR
ncbi:MAG: hypothetical protein ACI8RZ_007910, partial [Myxococcota bacterium]